MFETIKPKSKRRNDLNIHKNFLNIKIMLKNLEYYKGSNRQNK